MTAEKTKLQYLASCQISELIPNLQTCVIHLSFDNTVSISKVQQLKINVSEDLEPKTSPLGLVQGFSTFIKHSTPN